MPGPAQSILQSAGNYALLGGTLISVGGPGPNTITNGNVGLWSAATSNITGFPPATVTGITAGGQTAGIIATGPLTTGQAYADVQKAHVGLAGMASSVNVSNVDLGAMAPLSSGVYTFNGAAQQTGALVLDAQGQNGVTWVFQIGTSLTTSVNSTITFINLGSNGGSDLGVFWNAGAGITIGNNNTILGNYIAGTSISFTGSTSTLGAGGSRVLALAAISFAGPGSINPLGGPGGSDFSSGLAYNSAGAVVPVKTSGGVPTLPPSGNTGSVLLSNTGTYTPGTSGSVLVGGTPLGIATTTIDGNIANGSAPASLAVTTATVTLTGTNTYTGGTTVTGGTLVAGSANLPANQGVVLANSGTLTFNQPADGSFDGAISGNGAVSKQGAGALTISGANTYTGGTIINAGSLVTNTAALPTNQAVAVNGPGVLVFNQTADGTFGGFITGGGQIRKQGGGRLTLARPTLSPLDVQTGSLYFTEALGTTTVAAGALLGGTGTINGNLVNSGTLSPGNSVGTINVTGNYTQTTTGKLIIEIASATSFDHLTVAGTAALAGTLQVETLGGYNPIGQSFTFLTAAGGLTGTFGTFTNNVSNSAATAANVTYNATSATVAFSQRPFAGFAQTSNQAAIGAAAQAVPVQTAALNTLPQASQFPAALNAISPQGYQVWSDFAFAHSTSLADRLLRDQDSVIDHEQYYFEGGQRRGRTLADADVGSSRYSTSSGLVGGNSAIRGHTSVGGYFAFGKTIAGLGSAGSRTTVKEKTLGVSASWADGPMFAEAMLAYGFNRYESTRSIQFPGTAAIATSSTRGHQWTTGLTVGQHIRYSRVAVSPFAGLLASRWTGNSFAEEDAGAFGATIGRQKARSLRSQFGAEARVTLGMFQPHVRAAWQHEFSDGSRDINASFGSTNYVVATARAPRNSALYSAGVDLVFSPYALLYTDLTAQTGGSTHVFNEWRVGLAVTF